MALVTRIAIKYVNGKAKNIIVFLKTGPWSEREIVKVAL